MSSKTAQARLSQIDGSFTPPSSDSIYSTEPSTEHAPYPYPVPNPLTPFWRTQLHPLDSARTTPDLPAETDVLIIGAGYAGASTAYHLQKDNPNPPRITILEAREACSGATGRNGGHLKPDVYFQVPRYTALFGAEAADELAAFESSQVLAVKELVEREGIDCDFGLTRAVDVCLDADHAAKCKADFLELQARGRPSVRDVFFSEGATAEMVSGVKGAKCAFTFTAGHVWPYKLVMHLLGLAVGRGANLQTHTPVTSVAEARDDEGWWSVDTPRGRLRARQVVFCTNAYTAGVAPQYRDKIIPVKGICSRLSVPPGAAVPHLPNTYSLRYAPGIYDYQITRPDGSIVIGGAKQWFWHDRSHWYGVTDDASLIAPAEHHFPGFMQRNYRGWEHSHAELDMLWTGIMGYTADMMPHIGEVPSKPGQFVMAGFNGHGMPLIFLSSKGLASMILHAVPFEQTGIPRLFKTTAERLASEENLILNSKPQ
ncbi:fad dependent oxidoreductase superfamily protein [Diplodia corticola]|uniref:Fad dependent oxidoreductase superfamily protein n=1 Tax=Diplodia corticola TaxID=236234 RepID=A0A1J9S7T3_9PEZI|nr:fad dependent oxidoreductase superfamily protein [Diplodia corticola]OJD35972.1 fad dependent oxidoreductase superfamily protein [Diplodia corticola]